MAIDPGFSQLSNNLVYSAMFAYTGSMVAFSAALAFGQKGRTARVAARVPATFEELAASSASSTSTTAGTSAAAGSSAAGSSSSGATAVLEAERPVGNSAIESLSSQSDLDDLAPPPRGLRSLKNESIGVSMFALATLFLFGGFAARGLATGRVPWGNMYEFSLGVCLATSLAYLGLLTRRDVKYLGVFVAAPVLLGLGLAITVLYTEAAQLIPALRSYWLLIHVTAAIICAGMFAVGAALSGLYLVQARAERRGKTGRITSNLPSAAALDRLSYKVHAFTFPLWTFAIVAGAIWAENAWGRYWGWDPKETWSFITWTVYACYLHARATAGWRGAKAAGLSLLGMATLLFNFFGVNIFFVGFHSYSGL